ncbi:hypothetical protein NS506_03286 [Nocardia seriolae]|uniref:Uncharacterized protein n=1 Tax=Nocardia seriolae TaxID=37332 RepID=A0ABC8ATK9_9NOCA|nr:hypothetical protein [Nocardia seriolae]APA97339.1 hypothetical protein NS506_03286 [Nocardia seriolae]
MSLRLSPHLPEKIDQKTNPAPADLAPAAPQPEPQPQQPASVPDQKPSGTGDPATTLPQLGLGAPGQTAPPAQGGVEDVTAVLAGGTPVPGQTVTLPSGNTTVTTGADNSTIIGTTDPTTGHNKTNVYDSNGLLIATAESDIVLGTGGLSRDTTITSIGGTITQVRSVDDGHGHITSWTANPDGSHSVRYADGTVIKEHAPGSSTPDEVVHLDPDGLGGHVTEYNRDGTTTQADFRPGVLGAPVTLVTNPDGSQIQVVTVPGHTNGVPYSILTSPDHTRMVYQPDGTTIPIDRYNDMIGGPNYGNQFDPLTGTWRTDPVTARGPMVTGPDGTSTQQWTYRNRKGEELTATATFSADGNLSSLRSGDYTGFDTTDFRTVDSITVPVSTGHADAGNVTDDSRLYWDAILTVSGLPELGYRADVMIGTRLIARELAAKGVSETGIQLATSQLITRGGTSFTGIAGAASEFGGTTSPFGTGASSGWWQFATRYRNTSSAPISDAISTASAGIRDAATTARSKIEVMTSSSAQIARAITAGIHDTAYALGSQIKAYAQLGLNQAQRIFASKNSAAAESMATGGDAQIIADAKAWIAERPGKFDLSYSTPDLNEILKEGRRLGLNDREVHDLITTGSRKLKPISATELKEQMANWVNVVKPRGYPYRFDSAQEFHQFGNDLKAALEGRGLPADDVVIQGSALRKPAAADVDIATLVDRDKFDSILIARYDGRIATRPSGDAPGERISLAGLTHEQLVDLGKRITSNEDAYTAQAKTFGNAITNGTISSKLDILKPLKDARKSISSNYPGQNVESISIQLRDGAFDTQPNLQLR